VRRGAIVLLAVLVAGCTNGGTVPTTTEPPPTTTTAQETTTTVERLADCPAPPYDIGFFPSGISSDQVPVADLPFDDYTIVPGSSSEIWLADDGSLAMALIRGALPPEQWPGESQIVDIDGVDARVGPFEGGEWVVAWFEAPGERCDQYTLVFYPPVDPQEVEATIESMDRTAG
jgi:hypothetical protein